MNEINERVLGGIPQEKHFKPSNPEGLNISREKTGHMLKSESSAWCVSVFSHSFMCDECSSTPLITIHASLYDFN